MMAPFSDEPYTQTKDGKDDEGEEGGEDDKDEPAREKVKPNTEGFSVEGQSLVKFFPSINGSKLKNLPVEIVELTYSE